jgi:serine kinase of HPr protein (carbohydrate metabolism regulator)
MDSEFMNSENLKNMTVKDIVDKLSLTVHCGAEGLSRKVNGAYVSDLLSDVMGCANENQLWITLQTHKNVLAIASLKDISAIILVKGLKPEPATMEQSEREGIPVLGTTDSTFEITGKLYNLLNNSGH